MALRFATRYEPLPDKLAQSCCHVELKIVKRNQRHFGENPLADHKSAIKRIRSNEHTRIRNPMYRSRTRTLNNKVRIAGFTQRRHVPH